MVAGDPISTVRWRAALDRRYATAPQRLFQAELLFLFVDAAGFGSVRDGGRAAAVGAFAAAFGGQSQDGQVDVVSVPGGEVTAESVAGPGAPAVAASGDEQKYGQQPPQPEGEAAFWEVVFGDGFFGFAGVSYFVDFAREFPGRVE